MDLKNCRISIHRNSNDEISVELHDRTAGVCFFRGVLSLEAFARAITGQAEVSFDGATVRGLEKLGLTIEVKTENIPIPQGGRDYYGDKFAVIHAGWVKPYEVDGWQADIDRSFNSHRAVGSTYKTHFRRWVKTSEDV